MSGEELLKRTIANSEGRGANLMPHKASADQNRTLSFHALLQKMLSYAQDGLSRFEFLQDVSKILLDFSCCDSLNLWIREEEKLYCCSVKKGDELSCFMRVRTCVEKDDSQEAEGENSLEKICEAILFGHLESPGSRFRQEGEIWLSLPENSSKPDAQENGNISESMNSGVYRSSCLIPIKAGNDNLGILLLKSSRPGYFDGEDMKVYEDVAHTLAVAYLHRTSQISLRERVKELTCLYDIAQVVAQPSLSLNEVLQEIVNLLPHAWLYPEAASSRIVINGFSYMTGDFRESPFRQSSEIFVFGEPRGFVEVVYKEKKPEIDEGPFLREERNLIDAVARKIALVIEHKGVEDEKARIQGQLRHADRLATIGQLAAGVAHELNEPLSAILGFAQLMRKTPDLPIQTLQDVDKIVNASLHAREVVKKLLLFSRQTVPSKTLINLNEIIEEGMYFVSSRCAKMGIRLVKELSPDLPEIAADQGQMQQVLINLVVNAIQAMQQGGMLTIKTYAHKDNVFLTVNDTGTGMSQDVLSKIFVPFFTTKDIGKGTGLGLPVVHGIVTSHGGSIHVDSSVGHGTLFKVILPVGEKPAGRSINK